MVAFMLNELTELRREAFEGWEYFAWAFTPRVE